MIDTHRNNINNHPKRLGRDWKTAKRLITPEKVKWALSSFKPYKSPGKDNIPPVSPGQYL